MPDPSFNDLTVRFYSSSVEAASKLEYQGIFQSSASVSARALFLEAILTTGDLTPAYETIHGEQKIRYYVGRSFGVQLSLEVAKWDSSMSLSLAAVAAQVQLSGMSVTYHLELLGMPAALRDEFIKAIGVTGPLNEKAYSNFRRLMTETLPAYLRKAPDDHAGPDEGKRPPLGLSDVKIPASSSSADDADTTRAINFALKHLSFGDNLESTLKAIKAGENTAERAVITDVVYLLYRRLAGISPERTREFPDDGSKKKAMKWLNFEEVSI